MKLTCPDCRDTKPSSEFYKDKSKANGYQSYCKPCARIRSAERFRRRVGAKGDYLPRGEARPAEIGRCAKCDKEFEIRHPGAKYCSRGCSNRRPGRGDGVDPRLRSGQQLAMVSCDWCGALFTSHLPHTRCCSPGCRRARRASLAVGNHARRALKYGVKYIHVEGHVIFERDDWICGICGDLIDPEVRYPDRMCASIDHIIPISLGGDHLPENLQAAHLDCNARKGAQAPASAVPTTSASAAD